MVKMTTKRQRGPHGEVLYNLWEQKELVGTIGYWQGTLYVQPHMDPRMVERKVIKHFPSLPYTLVL